MRHAMPHPNPRTRLNVPLGWSHVTKPEEHEPRAHLSYDATLDVLTVWQYGKSCWRAYESAADRSLILGETKAGEVIQVQYIGTRALSWERWSQHAGRAEVPELLLAHMDAWVRRGDRSGVPPRRRVRKRSPAA